ncbi:MAG: hypothetical protein ACK5LK_04575 [Chthoniobacterales bacterium]
MGEVQNTSTTCRSIYRSDKAPYLLSPRHFSLHPHLRFFCKQRLGQSLWDDEEYNVRRSINGRYKYSEKTDEFYFREVRWRETFYFYDVPNNHVLHSIIARITLHAWQALTGQSSEAINETVLRLPAFLAAALFLAAVAFLFREYGFTAAGVIAALLLSIHPWILRYGAEARGYSLTLLWLCLLGIIWRRALTHGTWPQWALWGLLQFAALYTVPSSVYVIVILNLAVLPILYFENKTNKNFIGQSGRWFISTSLAAMATIQCMLPLVPQAQDYFENYDDTIVHLGWLWVRNVLGFYLGGVSWTKTRILDSTYPEWMPWVHKHFWIFAVFATLVAIFFLIGLIRFAKRDKFTLALTLAFFADPLGVYAQGALKEQFVFEWYLIFGIPLAAGFTAIGIHTLTRQTAKISQQKWLSPTLIASLLLAYFGITASFRSWLINNPLQAFRESVLITRGQLPPEQGPNPKIVTLSFSDPPSIYDSQVHVLHSANEMIRQLQKADATAATVFVNLGHLPFVPWHSPKMWALLTQTNLFDYYKHFQGFDPTLDRTIYKYKNGSIKKIDLTKYASDDRGGTSPKTF